MVAARTSDRGLSPTDLERIRDTLAAGRKPKVQFTESAGQIAGQIGQVVGLTDPRLSDEWLTVRFGRDELPFAPGDLMLATRSSVARKSVASVAAMPSQREEVALSPTVPYEDTGSKSAGDERRGRGRPAGPRAAGRSRPGSATADRASAAGAPGAAGTSVSPRTPRQPPPHRPRQHRPRQRQPLSPSPWRSRPPRRRQRHQRRPLPRVALAAGMSRGARRAAPVRPPGVSPRDLSQPRR